MARLVLLDANALLLPFQFPIHLDAELRRLLGDAEVMVPSPVIEELDRLAKRDRKARAAARLARKYRVLESPGPADEAMIQLATRLGAIVVTNDQPLLDRLASAGVPRIFLRSRNHLAAEGL